MSTGKIMNVFTAKFIAGMICEPFILLQGCICQTYFTHSEISDTRNAVIRWPEEYVAGCRMPCPLKTLTYRWPRLSL